MRKDRRRDTNRSKHHSICSLFDSYYRDIVSNALGDSVEGLKITKDTKVKREASIIFQNFGATLCLMIGAAKKSIIEHPKQIDDIIKLMEKSGKSLSRAFACNLDQFMADVENVCVSDSERSSSVESSENSSKVSTPASRTSISLENSPKRKTRQATLLKVAPKLPVPPTQVEKNPLMSDQTPQTEAPLIFFPASKALPAPAFMDHLTTMLNSLDFDALKTSIMSKISASRQSPSTLQPRRRQSKSPLLNPSFTDAQDKHELAKQKARDRYKRLKLEKEAKIEKSLQYRMKYAAQKKAVRLMADGRRRKYDRYARNRVSGKFSKNDVILDDGVDGRSGRTREVTRKIGREVRKRDVTRRGGTKSGTDVKITQVEVVSRVESNRAGKKDSQRRVSKREGKTRLPSRNAKRSSRSGLAVRSRGISNVAQKETKNGNQRKSSSQTPQLSRSRPKRINTVKRSSISRVNNSRRLQTPAKSRSRELEKLKASNSISAKKSFKSESTFEAVIDPDTSYTLRRRNTLMPKSRKKRDWEIIRTKKKVPSPIPKARILAKESIRPNSIHTSVRMNSQDSEFSSKSSSIDNDENVSDKHADKALKIMSKRGRKRRLEKATEKEIQIEKDKLKELEAKIGLSMTDSNLPIETSRINEIYKICKTTDGTHVIAGRHNSAFYREQPGAKSRYFVHEDKKMVNFKMYKDLWIWVSDDSSGHRSLLFVRTPDESSNTSIDKTETGISLKSASLIIDRKYLYFLTDFGIERLDLNLTIQNIANNSLKIESAIEKVLQVGDCTDMCIKRSWLFVISNSSNTIVRVSLRMIQEDNWRQKKGSVLKADIKYSQIEIQRFFSGSNYIRHLKKCRVKVLGELIIVSRPYCIFILDDQLDVQDHIPIQAAPATNFQFLKLSGRDFMAVLHSDNYLTLISIFKGRLLPLSRFFDSGKGYSLQGIVDDGDNAVVLYGSQCYSKRYQFDVKY